MNDLNDIILRLQDRKLKKISDKTGIHPLTLALIRKGKTTNPKYQTIQKLKEYFQENP